jgi:hypothetical protein
MSFGIRSPRPLGYENNYTTDWLLINTHPKLAAKCTFRRDALAAMMAPVAAPVASTGPHDSAASSATRVAAELATWIAGPWAAAELAGGPWAILPAALVLVGVPAVFSTVGDKKTVLVPTPGPVRLAIELVLAAIGVVSAWLVWPVWAALLVSAIAAAMLVTNAPRFRWLAQGAPLEQ